MYEFYRSVLVRIKKFKKKTVLFQYTNLEFRAFAIEGVTKYIAVDAILTDISPKIVTSVMTCKKSNLH